VCVAGQVNLSVLSSQVFTTVTVLRLQSTGLSHHLALYADTNISEEDSASIFRVEV
jgi:hypothetical protein